MIEGLKSLLTQCLEATYQTRSGEEVKCSMARVGKGKILLRQVPTTWEIVSPPHIL